MTWVQLWPRRLVAGLGSAVNYLTQTKPGIAIGTLFTGRVSVTAGVDVDPAPATLAAVSLTDGVSLVTSASGTVKPAQTPGLSLLSLFSATDTAKATPGFELVQTKVDLAGTYGATTATNTTVSGNAWTSTANAQGVHNGTMSTHNGTIGAQHAYLTFAFPTFPNKSALTITSAKLRFYARQAGTVGGNGGLRFTWGTAANPDLNTVADNTGNVDYTSTPFEVDLLAAGITTFALLETVVARIRGTIPAAAATVTQDCDAVELVVAATRTDLL